jgi:hypothetical protein
MDISSTTLGFAVLSQRLGTKLTEVETVFVLPRQDMGIPSTNLIIHTKVGSSDSPHASIFFLYSSPPQPRNLAAACSGVISRWGSAIIS